jgi:hypothetical protein
MLVPGSRPSGPATLAPNRTARRRWHRIRRPPAGRRAIVDPAAPAPGRRLGPAADPVGTRAWWDIAATSASDYGTTPRRSADRTGVPATDRTSTDGPATRRGRHRMDRRRRGKCNRRSGSASHTRQTNGGCRTSHSPPDSLFHRKNRRSASIHDGWNQNGRFSPPANPWPSCGRARSARRGTPFLNSLQNI